MQTPTHAGWFDDPEDAEQLRYFDGVVWTKHTTPRSTRQAAPAPVQPSQPASSVPPGQPYGAQQPGAQPGAQSGAQSGAQRPLPPTAPPQWQHPNQQFPGSPQPGQWMPPAYGGLPTAQPSTPDGQPLASYWQRVGAFILDWVVQGVLAAIVGYYFLAKAMGDYVDQFNTMVGNAESGRQPDLTALADSIDTRALMAYSVVAIAVFVLYQTFFLTRFGATPGKLAVGIRVRLRDRPGRLSTGEALRRVALPVVLFVGQIVPLLGVLALLVRVLDLLWASWDPQKQALHDKVGRTNVVVGRAPRP
ncbi:RDD family protein [Phycicoccus sp. Soil748]|uniref:RDD family protein n=1 Tax=Phycicoccus sp. Soil748 TaxID=1736397 RepID=UPI000702C9B2|nr:RDD family protein [Phycicoccus sp. Soil748]KRE57274.1 hypothetical protein ASG70_02415 [Phycicoccus sp. Soil748]